MAKTWTRRKVPPKRRVLRTDKFKMRYMIKSRTWAISIGFRKNIWINFCNCQPGKKRLSLKQSWRTSEEETLCASIQRRIVISTIAFWVRISLISRLSINFCIQRFSSHSKMSPRPKTFSCWKTKASNKTNATFQTKLIMVIKLLESSSMNIYNDWWNILRNPRF